jgi:hypothetical protein
MRSNPNVTKVLWVSAVLAVTSLNVGCGKGGLKSIVKDAKVQVAQINGESFVEATILLGTGNVLLPSFNYNIKHPRNPDVVLGVVTMRPASGGTEVIANVNLNQAIGTDLVDPRLPNGQALPIGGIGNAVVVGIPAGDAVKVYLGLGEKFAMLGVTTNIRQLDGMGRNGIPDVFIPLKTGNVMTTAGFYFSPTPSMSGVGVFADMSQIVFSQNASVLMAALATDRLAVKQDVIPVYQKSPISRNKERQLLDFLATAHQRRQRFTLAK